MNYKKIIIISVVLLVLLYNLSELSYLEFCGVFIISFLISTLITYPVFRNT